MGSCWLVSGVERNGEDAGLVEKSEWVCGMQVLCSKEVIAGELGAKCVWTMYGAFVVYCKVFAVKVLAWIP